MVTKQRKHSQAPLNSGEPKATNQIRISTRVAPVLPPKDRSTLKANQRKKSIPARKQATRSVRVGSKTASILDMLKRPNGATIKDLTKVTGWQPHSVRGFISGTLGRKMGLNISSTKTEAGDRRYSVTR